jgi:hypothetical protein
MLFAAAMKHRDGDEHATNLPQPRPKKAHLLKFLKTA